MESAGLGFAVVGEARSTANSVAGRIENILQGRKAFEGLSASLNQSADNLNGVDTLKGDFPDALPESVAALFDRTLNHVRENLSDADAVEKDISKAFAGSSSFVGVLKAKGRRVFRANALMSRINATETKINQASNQLPHLTTLLTTAVKVETRTQTSPLKRSSIL